MAPVLCRAIKESAERLRAGDDVEAAMAGGAELIANAGFVLDYFKARHAETLAPRFGDGGSGAHSGGGQARQDAADR